MAAQLNQQSLFASVKELDPDAKEEVVMPVLTALMKHARPCYYFTTEDCCVDDLSVSKVGGKPYLREGEEWPQSQGAHLAFFWQFRLEDAPEAVQKTIGASTGLFQLFLHPELPEYDPDHVSGDYVARVVTDVVSRAPDSVCEGDCQIFPEKKITGWREETDFPHTEDWADLGLSTEDYDLLDLLMEVDDICCKSGDKILGWPHWCVFDSSICRNFKLSLGAKAPNGLSQLTIENMPKWCR